MDTQGPTIACFFNDCNYRIPVSTYERTGSASIYLEVDLRVMRIHYRHAHQVEIPEEHDPYI